jgi:hypothetical protein
MPSFIVADSLHPGSGQWVFDGRPRLGSPTAHPMMVPRPRVSSQAAWSLALGIVGLVLSPFMGGALPGLLAVWLARSAEVQIGDSHGWLTGSGQARVGRILGWASVLLAVAVAVALTVTWLLRFGAAGSSPTYPGEVN